MDRTELTDDQIDQLKVVEAPQEAGRRAVLLEAGATIGKYELIEKIGSGAISVVYKARDVTLNRPVAIKFLLTDILDGPELLTRFKQEARALGTLEHRNIVKVHEIDATASGVPYIVMNYLSGITLAESLASEGRLSPGRCLALMLQACTALEHAHANGIIHRDIKPSNFVLAQENGTEVVKLIDFGIAKNMLDETALTKTGNVFGTPLYMSPEQCAGEKLDERSDIYSLGCVMYEALAGRAPLVGDNSLSTMQKHLKEAPERLLRTLSTAASDQTEIKGLDSVIMKCLEKKPADRYQKISALEEDLSSLLQGKKPLPRLALRGQKKQIIAIAMIGISLCIGALTILEISKRQNIPTVQSTASVAATRAQAGPTSESDAVAESIGETKTNKIEQPARVVDPILLAHKQSLFRGLMREARDAAQEKNWNVSLEKSKESLTIFSQVRKGPSRKGEIYWLIARSEFGLRDFPAARRDYKLALDAVSGEKDNESKHWKYQALIGLGQTAIRNNEYREALDLYEEAYKTIQTTTPDLKNKNNEERRQKHIAVCMASIGDVYLLLNKRDECKTYWRASLKIRPDNHDLVEKLRKLQ